MADRGPDRLATDHALQTEGLHQPRHGAAGNIVALTLQLPADLAHAIDAEVPLNFWLQRAIPSRSRRPPGRTGAPGDMRMVGRGNSVFLGRACLRMVLPSHLDAVRKSSRLSPKMRRQGAVRDRAALRPVIYPVARPR